MARDTPTHSRAREHREQLDSLIDRMRTTCRLGDPMPAVSTDVASLAIDLVIELERCVVELEQLEVRA